MKIDCHLHYFVSDDRWVRDRLLLMDEADVSYSVLQALPHLQFKDNVCGDNEDVLRAVRSHPDRFIGSIYIDPRQPDSLESLARYSGEGFRCGE